MYKDCMYSTDKICTIGCMYNRNNRNLNVEREKFSLCKNEQCKYKSTLHINRSALLKHTASTLKATGHRKVPDLCFKSEDTLLCHTAGL